MVLPSFVLVLSPSCGARRGAGEASSARTLWRAEAWRPAAWTERAGLVVPRRPLQLSMRVRARDEEEVEGWVWRAFKEERPLSEVVDPSLLGEVHAKKQVLAVFHVALGCTEPDPELRPRMRAVAESLDRVN